MALRLFRDERRVPYQKGIGRFEVVLEALGLGGGVPELVRRRFMEMSEIRHNLVHRMGIIDSKLAEACPWLKMTVGHRIHLNDEVLNNYSMAIRFYAIEIDRRIRLAFSEPIPDIAEQKYQFYLTRLEPGREPLPCPVHHDFKQKPKSNTKATPSKNGSAKQH